MRSYNVMLDVMMDAENKADACTCVAKHFNKLAEIFASGNIRGTHDAINDDRRVKGMVMIARLDETGEPIDDEDVPADTQAPSEDKGDLGNPDGGTPVGATRH